MRGGHLFVASRHITCAIAVNENEACGLPREPRNAHIHIAACCSATYPLVPIADGALVLGIYQSVLFFELDGQCRRMVGVRIAGVP